jgi:hypothetical protein
MRAAERLAFRRVRRTAGSVHPIGRALARAPAGPFVKRVV